MTGPAPLPGSEEQSAILKFTFCQWHHCYQAQPRRLSRTDPILIPPPFHLHLPAVILLFYFCSLAHPGAGQEEGRGMHSAHSRHRISPLSPLCAAPPVPWPVVWDPPRSPSSSSGVGQHCTPARRSPDGVLGLRWAPGTNPQGFLRVVVCCVPACLFSFKSLTPVLAFTLFFTLQVSSCRHAASVLQMQNREFMHLEPAFI